MAKEKKIVNDTFDKVDFLYSKGAIVNLEKNPRFPQKVKTGRPSIDWVTDGGIPRGREILIAGEPSAGKSSLTIQIAEEIGERILYADTEATLTTDYLLSLGATPSKFDHFIPETTELMCDIIRQQIPNYDVIIIDSINPQKSRKNYYYSIGWLVYFLINIEKQFNKSSMQLIKKLKNLLLNQRS